ncbi:MAG: hypothetical protein NXH88_09230 [Hyphomonas sp.]|nr:hypothetical protein [Hyphomonas sp.]
MSEWYDFFEELVFGSSDRSVGTILSGLNTTTARTNGLIAGTQEVADVLITDRGSLNAAQDAQDGNITTASQSDGGFTASASPSSANNISAGSGSKTTGSVTVTPVGGVTPYTYAWTKKSGDDIPADSASAATTTFTGSVTTGEYKFAVYTCTVTDSTGGTPLTTTVDVGVSIGDNSVSGIGAA